MPQKVLKFTGINRSSNEFQNNGACEELINIRPSIANSRVVKPKTIKFENTNATVYNHVFADKSIFVGVKADREFDLVVIDEQGAEQRFDSIPTEDDNAYELEYSMSFVGNMMIFSFGEEIRAYNYKNDVYERVEASVPDIAVTYSVSAGYGSSTQSTISSSNPKSDEFKEETLRQWSAAIGKNSRKNQTFGPVLVAINYSLSDGTEFWTNKWLYINPFTFLPYGEDGTNMIYYEDSGSKGQFVFNSYDISFKIKQTQFSSSYFSNMVESVNVYATRPVFPYNIDTMTSSDTGVHAKQIYATVNTIKALDITNQLLYFQKSIPVSDIEKGDVLFSMSFGDEQAGEKVLEVDNGPVRRVGESVSLNNRLHVYNSRAVLYSPSVTCHSDTQSGFEEKKAYVYLESSSETIVLQTKALVRSAGSTYSRMECFYPDARAKKILIENYESGTYSTISLEPSGSYNYAYGSGTYNNGTTSSSSIKSTKRYFSEPNTINVSEQYNPFVFDVAHSYSVGGAVLDLATTYLPISSTQISQFPLTVFTSNGIFTMEQGSGTSLYGNVMPIQPLVIEGKATPTPYGTFFVSSNELYVLTGRDVTKVSDVLRGKIENDIRKNDAYKSLCLTGGGVLYNFDSLLSKSEFADFVSNASLSYDQLNNELIISSANEDVLYSYVFNIDTKSFHKISGRFVQHQKSSRYINRTEHSKGTIDVVDLHNEDDSVARNILLQSRPFSLEAFSTHIQRLKLLVDTKLEQGQNLCFSVFGSDNLYDWKCIISAQKQNTVLRHIRTNRAAKSYRDYVILISGLVSTDTDLSDIIADYTVVSRRFE